MSDRAAFAGLAMNRTQPVITRLQLANQALAQYVAVEDELQELIEYGEQKTDGAPDPADIAYDDMVNRLREILEKKR